MDELTLTQLKILGIMGRIYKSTGRMAYLYEICAESGYKANHLICILKHLESQGILEYPDEYKITPTMKNVMDLYDEQATVDEMVKKLQLTKVTIKHVLSILKNQGLIVGIDDDITEHKTFVVVTDKDSPYYGMRGYIIRIECGLYCMLYDEMGNHTKVDISPARVEEVDNSKFCEYCAQRRLINES